MSSVRAADVVKQRLRIAARRLGTRDPNAAARVEAAFEDRFYVELQRPYERGDVRRNALLRCEHEMLAKEKPQIVAVAPRTDLAPARVSAATTHRIAVASASSLP